MSVASFVASRGPTTTYPAPCPVGRPGFPSRGSTSGETCLPTPRQERRAPLDAAVRRSFEDSDGDYGSLRRLDTRVIKTRDSLAVELIRTRTTTGPRCRLPLLGRGALLSPDPAVACGR